MKKFLFAAIALIVVAAALLAWHFWPRVIDTTLYPAKEVEKTVRNLDPIVMGSVRLGYFSSGYNESPEAFVFSGGSLSKPHKSIFSGVVIQHPKGTFLFEGGIGENIPKQFDENFNMWQKEIFKFNPEPPAKTHIAMSSLTSADLDFILLTHLHWDHAGVIADFPKTPIWTTRAEYEWAMAQGEEHPGFFKSQYDSHTIPWNFIQFENLTYASFEKSFDIYGDGTVVLVPLEGHTAGSLGMFVTLKNGQRYFFIGDTSWSVEALKIPAHRPPLAQHLADLDVEKLSGSLAQLHRLMKQYPDLIIVPTHDATAFQSIEKLIDWKE